MIVIRVQHSIGPFDRDNTISVSSYIHPLKKNNIISFIIHSYVVQNVSKIEKFCFRLVCLLFLIIFHLHDEEVCKTCLFCYMRMDTSPPFSRSSWNFCREVKFFTIDKRSEWKKSTMIKWRKFLKNKNAANSLTKQLPTGKKIKFVTVTVNNYGNFSYFAFTKYCSLFKEISEFCISQL